MVDVGKTSDESLCYHVFCVADASGGIVVVTRYFEFAQERFRFQSRNEAVDWFPLILFHKVETRLVDFWVGFFHGN